MTNAAVTRKDTPTSSGVCTPRYIRLNAMSTVSTMSTARSHFRPVYRAMPP